MGSKEVGHDKELLSDVFDAAFNAMVGAKCTAVDTHVSNVNEIDNIVEAAREGATCGQRLMIAAARDGSLVKMRKSK